jgi:hypothetical protein
MPRPYGEISPFWGYLQLIGIAGMVIFGLATLGIFAFGKPTTEKKSVLVALGISAALWAISTFITRKEDH